MAIRALADLPSGLSVIIDANILIYAANNSSAECESFLQRCTREEIHGLITLEALAEACHRLMVDEAFSRRMIRRPSASDLRRNRKVIPQLPNYWIQLSTLLGLNLLFVPLDEQRFRRAQVMRERHNLMTNDSLILAAAETYGITSLATRDDDFEPVAWLTVYKPGDIP